MARETIKASKPGRKKKFGLPPAMISRLKKIAARGTLAEKRLKAPLQFDDFLFEGFDAFVVLVKRKV